jgi:hypothetical protein
MVVLMGEQLLHDEPLREGFPREHRPAAALHRGGGVTEQRAERGEPVEGLVDLAAQRAAGFATAVGVQVGPVDRVQHVPTHVERQGPFETDQVAPALLGARLVELLDCGIGACHICGVVFVVVQFDHTGRQVRLEIGGVVGEIGQ